MFWGSMRGFAQSLEQPGGELPQDRRDGSAGRHNHNSRSIYGAYPACFGQLPGCEGPIAPLQALDLREPRG